MRSSDEGYGAKSPLKSFSSVASLPMAMVRMFFALPEPSGEEMEDSSESAFLSSSFLPNFEASGSEAPVPGVAFYSLFPEHQRLLTMTGEKNAPVRKQMPPVKVPLFSHRFRCHHSLTQTPQMMHLQLEVAEISSGNHSWENHGDIPETRCEFLLLQRARGA